MTKPMFQAKFTREDVINHLKAETEQEFDDIVFRLFSKLGEDGVTYARTHGGFKNQTGNLRNSEGYLIAKDGEIKTANFKEESFGTDNATGTVVGRQLAVDILSGFQIGWVLILVAGMEYAVKVESMGKDVLSSAAISVEQQMEIMTKEIRK